VTPFWAVINESLIKGEEMRKTKKIIIKELLDIGIWNIDKNDSKNHLNSLLSIWKTRGRGRK
jgi:hypothetical protein